MYMRLEEKNILKHPWIRQHKIISQFSQIQAIRISITEARRELGKRTYELKDISSSIFFRHTVKISLIV